MYGYEGERRSIRPMTEEMQVVVESATEVERPQGAIAPWWHTAAVLVLLFTWAFIGRGKAAMSEMGPHSVVYLSSIMTGWMLLGAVVAGVYQRRMFFASTLRHKARPWTIEGTRAVGIYFGFAFSLTTLALLVFFVMFLVKFHGGGSISSMKDMMAPLTKYSDGRVQRALGPRGPGELVLWLGVSVTAGFCEEHVFRGYLLQQALTLTRSLRVRPWMGQAIAVVATSLLFGSLHLYEGVGGALVITLLGCVYAVCALSFGNLRAVIVAHVLQDLIAGVMLLGFRRHGM
jgi:membrane protease YdiL (CAAX protease family)